VFYTGPSICTNSRLGSIIANKGFINHVGSPDKNGVKAIKSNHIVIWGAFQSLGEMFGMISLTPISDHYGRKTTMMVIWVILVGVSPQLLLSHRTTADVF
jgi:hypothetical protein